MISVLMLLFQHVPSTSGELAASVSDDWTGVGLCAPWKCGGKLDSVISSVTSGSRGGGSSDTCPFLKGGGSFDVVEAWPGEF